MKAYISTGKKSRPEEGSPIARVRRRPRKTIGQTIKIPLRLERYQNLQENGLYLLT